jgi:hypothetical protein
MIMFGYGASPNTIESRSLRSLGTRAVGSQSLNTPRFACRRTYTPTCLKVYEKCKIDN